MLTPQVMLIEEREAHEQTKEAASRLQSALVELRELHAAATEALELAKLDHDRLSAQCESALKVTAYSKELLDLAQRSRDQATAAADRVRDECKELLDTAQLARDEATATADRVRNEFEELKAWFACKICYQPLSDYFMYVLRLAALSLAC